MRPKSLILLALALGCGLVASIGISQVLESRDQNPSAVELGPIYIAMVDIDRNTPLSEENTTLEQRPVTQIPEGALTDLIDFDGQRPQGKIYAGEAILKAKLGASERATRQIPKGFRVVTVKVDNTSGGSLILPGDRVDVNVYIREQRNLGVRSGMYTFLHDVSVFAVNSSIQYNADEGEQSMDAKTISLLVTPEQAAKVTMATEIGRVRLVMRGMHDEEQAEFEPITLDDFLDSETFSAKKNGDAKDGSLSGVLDKLDQQETPQVQAPVQQPKIEMQVAANAPYRMVVMEGAQTRVVEIQSDAAFPYSARPTTTNFPAEYQPADDTNTDDTLELEIPSDGDDSFVLPDDA